MRSPTDQDDISSTLFLTLQLANIEVRIVWWLEHVHTPLLLVVNRAGLKVQGREIGFV